MSITFDTADCCSTVSDSALIVRNGEYVLSGVLTDPLATGRLSAIIDGNMRYWSTLGKPGHFEIVISPVAFGQHAVLFSAQLDDHRILYQTEFLTIVDIVGVSSF